MRCNFERKWKRNLINDFHILSWSYNWADRADRADRADSSNPFLLNLFLLCLSKFMLGSPLSFLYFINLLNIKIILSNVNISGPAQCGCHQSDCKKELSKITKSSWERNQNFKGKTYFRYFQLFLCLLVLHK